MFEQLLKTWEMSALKNTLSAPASDGELLEAERRLQIKLPDDLRKFYQITNGVSLLDGNINLYPLLGEVGISTRSNDLRSWGWEISDDVVIVGDNGAGNLFAILKQLLSVESVPIIEIQEPGGEYGLAGSTFERFLHGRTIYYLLGDKKNLKALQALGVVTELCDSEPDDDALLLIAKYCDPLVEEYLDGDANRKVNFEKLSLWLNKAQKR